MRVLRKSTIIAAAGISVMLTTSQAPAQLFKSYAQWKSEAEAACAEVLASGELAALESFRRKYWNVPTPCLARASTAVSPFGEHGDGGLEIQHEKGADFLPALGRAHERLDSKRKSLQRLNL
jgi:hypothetical protein